jgi:predicted ABC-type transport system involved in lysophospholipase L1 biosynthesis ATPase subunit
VNDEVVKVQGLVKQYQALRPLRIESLVVKRGEVVSLMGLDAAAAEMFVGLLTGAVLPDEGDVHLLGRSTRDVADSDAWLHMLDAVGIVTDRAVLIAQFSVEQNIAIPFTLQVDPVNDETRGRVAGLAADVGLTPADLPRQVAQSSPQVVARVRLARALALDPKALFVEHPSATLPREAVKDFAADVARIARDRQLTVLTITADEAFATALGGSVLSHEPATGTLRPRSLWRKIFG